MVWLVLGQVSRIDSYITRWISYYSDKVGNNDCDAFIVIIVCSISTCLQRKPSGNVITDPRRKKSSAANVT
jgi:hypothetical protein